MSSWSTSFEFGSCERKIRFTHAIAINKCVNSHNFKMKNVNYWQLISLPLTYWGLEQFVTIWFLLIRERLRDKKKIYIYICIYIYIYKIIQIVSALWLAIKPFYMSVCKHSFRSSSISPNDKLDKLEPLRFSSWFPTLISCSPNLPRAYIRLCKHGNHFTFLHYYR